MKDGRYLHFHECDNGYDFTLFTSDGIEIDGGISVKNIREVFDAGVDVVVAGSSVFGAENPEEEIVKMLNV